MRRTHLHYPAQENDEAENINGTPNNAGPSRFPRLRLLDRILKSEINESTPLVNSRSSSSTFVAGNALRHRPLSHKRVFIPDRFIVSRSKYNMDAANYVLAQPAKVMENDELNVLKEMDMLNTKWRKEVMHGAMVKANVIPGLGQKEVLRRSTLSSEYKLPGTSATQRGEMWMEDYCKDGTWRSKPRNKPLISNAGLVIDMSHDITCTNSKLIGNLIDWSSKNIIAHSLNKRLILFEVNQTQITEEIENHKSEKICALKWNNAGNLLIICTFSSSMKLYDMQFDKFIWNITCNGEYSSSSSPTYAQCLCWSPDDKFIAVGCTRITIYCAQTGDRIKSVVAHSENLLVMLISPNSRYIASSSTDKDVRIFTWPALKPVFDIMYHYFANELAWNPFNSNILCIGGGLGDASISLWDMTIMDVISYRTVDFFGSVNHLAWNKVSGELVVHWSYYVEEDINTEYSIMPVLASFDRVVDKIPVAKNVEVHAVLWSTDHSQLGIYNDECLSIWNVFGDQYHYNHTCKKQQVLKKSKKNTRQSYFRSIHHTIR